MTNNGSGLPGRWFYVSFLGLGTLLVVIGGILFFNTVSFLAGAVQTTGTVVSVQESTTGDSPTYLPTVEFQPASSPIVQFTPKSSTTEAYKMGDKVSVWYQPARPQEARLASFLTDWFIPLLFVLVGSLFLAITLIIGLITRRNPQALRT